MKKWLARAVTAVMGAALLTLPATPGQAVSPTPRTLYQLPANAQCTKGLGNCAIYSKAAALPSGRLVAGFERASPAITPSRLLVNSTRAPASRKIVATWPAS